VNNEIEAAAVQRRHDHGVRGAHTGVNGLYSVVPREPALARVWVGPRFAMLVAIC
jgi:hypothetical protein